MNKEMIRNMEKNAIIDFTKSAVDPKTKKEIIADYMKKSRITSIGGAARSLGMAKSTIYHLLNPDKKKEYYDKYNLKKRSYSTNDGLQIIHHQLLVIRDRVDNKKIKIDDDMRKEIENIKEIAVELYMRTRKVIC